MFFIKAGFNKAVPSFQDFFFVFGRHKFCVFHKASPNLFILADKIIDLISIKRFNYRERDVEMMSPLLILLNYLQAGPAPRSGDGFLVAGIPFFIILILIIPYFIPSVIAFVRKHHNSAAILILNILLGWTIIGWIVCLVWSLTSKQMNQTINITTASPQSRLPESEPSGSSQAKTSHRRFCSKCGEKINSGDVFCSACGAKMK